MPTATILEEPPTEDAFDRPDPSLPGPRWTLRRATPLIAMVTGLVVIATAATIALTAGGPTERTTEPTAITVGPGDVSVVTQVYEPGEDGGWHAHPGIHAVAVQSGVLTVYDGDCRRQTYEPGRPYVGGQLPHLVRNETAEPVVMAVTYLNPRANTRATEHMAAPAGCAPVSP
jgi:quercetin dioxygenase-like cupin family protein